MAKTSRREKETRPLIGLAMAGGAPLGAIYEIGALRALDDALEGFSLNDVDVFVGVSAGGFLSACLANGLTTAQMCRAIVKREPGEHPFVPEIFFHPATEELSRRLRQAPGVIASAIGNYVSRREKRLIDALTGVGRVLPVGIFDNEPVREYVAKIFTTRPGRSDDFRELRRKLAIVTTDLESGEAVIWGTPGHDHIPISKAVQATTALPGLYPPVEIEERPYVDGVLRKTMHASVALEAGADLVFCVNPIVPVDIREAVDRHELEDGHLIREGLPSVLSQTIRTLIHSRMKLGLRAYDGRYPEASIVLVEPRREDHEIFFSNIFSFSSRRIVCARAYDATRRTLLARYDEIAPVVEAHGIRLNRGFLEDETADVWMSVGLPEISVNGQRPKAAVDGDALHDLEGLLERVERLAAQQA